MAALPQPVRENDTTVPGGPSEDPSEPVNDTVAKLNEKSEPALADPAPAGVAVYKSLIVPPPRVELGAHHKTSLCSYFRKGRCVQDNDCRYAHGEAELQRRADGTWDPTSAKFKTETKEEGAGKGGRKENQVPREVADTQQDMSGEEDTDADRDADGVADDVGDGTVTLCILNAPPWMKLEQFEALLEKQGVSYSSAKKRKGLDAAFVTFATAQEAEEGKEKLEGHRVQGCDLRVAAARPRATQPKGEEGGEGSAREVWEVVTPLGHMPYAAQLEQKRAQVAQALKQLVRKTRKCCPRGCPAPPWVSDAWSRGGLACELEGIMASPLVDGYRNKSEFTVGLSVSGERTVGFQMGQYKDGVTAISAPVGCKNTSPASCAFANLLQEVVASSALPVWEKKGNKGFWRMLTVREGRDPPPPSSGGVAVGPVASCMLVVQVNRSGAGVGEEEVEAEMERMRRGLTEGAAAALPPLPLTSLLVQDYGGVSNAAPPECPVVSLHGKGGEAWITDHLCGFKFHISPTAFFQVNSACASQLYTMAGDWAELNASTTLFDICCGTGTIGITLANRVAKVVGIEMSEAAIEDARKNAAINGLENCTFVAGKAENVLGNLLRTHGSGGGGGGGSQQPLKRQKREGEAEVEGGEESEAEIGGGKVVAILDPPRAGLHPIVLRTLRCQKEIRRLVYISCNVQTLIENAVELCAPLAEEGGGGEWGGGGGGRRNGWQRGRGRQAKVAQSKRRLEDMAPSAPFRPVKAMAVDMFPHTHHCEVVVLFER